MSEETAKTAVDLVGMLAVVVVDQQKCIDALASITASHEKNLTLLRGGIQETLKLVELMARTR